MDLLQQINIQKIIEFQRELHGCGKNLNEAYSWLQNNWKGLLMLVSDQLAARRVITTCRFMVTAQSSHAVLAYHRAALLPS